jgi:hypothetical protein
MKVKKGEADKIRALNREGVQVRILTMLSGYSRDAVHRLLGEIPKYMLSGNLVDHFEGHESWRKGGREWVRFLVRARDNFTCQSCGRRWEQGQRHLDVHHLNGMCGRVARGYESTCAIPKLITLCHKCHFNHPEHTLKTRGCG